VLKGPYTPKNLIKNTYFPLRCRDLYPSRLFSCEFSSFGNISLRDVCLLANIVELHGAQLVALKVPKRNIRQTQTLRLFIEIMTQLLKLIGRLCCEQFDTFHMDYLFDFGVNCAFKTVTDIFNTTNIQRLG